VINRLIHLGFLCILYEYFKGLETASKPALRTATGNTICSNIKQLAWCIAREAQCVLKTVIDRIEVEDKSIESQALRYREVLDTVADVNNLGSRSEVLVELEVTILTRLIHIYEQWEDTPTVRRFSLRRTNLHRGSSAISDPGHVAHTAQCWIETCDKLPALLQSLEIPIEAPLHTNTRPLFPAQQSALRCGHAALASALCNRNGAQHCLDMLKQNPLLAAAAAGNLHLLDPNIQDDNGLLKSRDIFHRTALFYAASCGNLEAFMALVQAGADVSDRDEAGQSILGAASAVGNTDIVTWLLKFGGVPSPNDHYLGSRAALHDAARAGHTDVCLVLLEKGAYVNYLVDGVTPVEAARATGFDDLADTLELSLANPANRYPVGHSFQPPQPRLQADGKAIYDSQRLHPYACATPLPFEVGSLDFANEIQSTPLHPGMGSAEGDGEYESDGKTLEASNDIESGIMFGD
jgi:Ankyrin repeats (3 copies)